MFLLCIIVYFQFDLSSTLFFVCNVVCAADLIIVPIYEAYRLMFSTCFPFERFDNG